MTARAVPRLRVLGSELSENPQQLIGPAATACSSRRGLITSARSVGSASRVGCQRVPQIKSSIYPNPRLTNSGQSCLPLEQRSRAICHKHKALIGWVDISKHLYMPGLGTGRGNESRFQSPSSDLKRSE